MVSDEVLTNAGELPAARLVLERLVRPTGHSNRVTVSAAGPLGQLWGLLLRRPMASAARSGVDGLITRLQRAP